MMKRGFLITILVISAFSLQAQLKLKVADKYFNELAYFDAVNLYKDLSEGNKSSTHSIRRTAECYQLINDTENSEIWYEKLVSSGEYNASDVYRYAQILKRNKKYEKANDWMIKLITVEHLVTTDYDNSIALAHKNNQTYFLDLLKDSAKFEIVALPELNSQDADFSPVILDNTTLAFASSRKRTAAINKTLAWDGSTFLDVYSSTINADKTTEKAIPFLKNELRSKYHEGPISFSNDNSVMYVTRSNYFEKKTGKSSKDINNLKLFISKKVNGEWQSYDPFKYNSDEFSIGHASVSKDGKKMFFTSDRPGSIGETDIWFSELIGQEWGTPKPLGENVNTEGKEMFPYYDDASGLLFFASDGHLGLGGLDVYVAYPDGNNGYSKVQNVGYPINTNADDFSLILTEEGTHGYFASNRNGGRGSDDIYGFSLLKPFTLNLEVQGLITDKRTGDILTGAIVELTGIGGDPIASTISDENGAYNFNLEDEKEYTISVRKNDYFDNQGSISTLDLPVDTEKIEKNLGLEKDPGLALYVLVKDAKTNTPLDSVLVKISDNTTGELFLSEMTNGSGDVLKGILNKKLDDRISYNIELSKEGYFSKTITFNHKIIQEGQIDVATVIDGGIFMDEEIEDLAILINPINFDLGKWNIRPDAAVELDRIVVIMNKYPKMVVELGAHTDCRASKSFNMRLSDKRAKSSAKYIQERITNSERISGKGYGESQLLNNCGCEGAVKSDCSEEEHQANRRTEFLVVSTGDNKVKVITKE